MKSILFVCRANRSKTSASISESVKRINDEIRTISLTIYEDWWVESSQEIKNAFDRSYGTEHIYEKAFSKKAPNNNFKYIDKYFKNRVDFWNIVFSERYLVNLEHSEVYFNYKYTRDELLLYANYTLWEFENILLKENPSIIFDYSSLGFMRGMLHAVASYQNINYLRFFPSRIEGYSYLSEIYSSTLSLAKPRLVGEIDEVDFFSNVYNKYHASGEAYSAVHMRKNKKHNLINLIVKIPQAVVAIFTEISIRAKGYNDKSLKYNYYKYISLFSRRLYVYYTRRCKGLLYKINERYITTDPSSISGVKYLFTMHVQPEASTSVDAPYCASQEYVIQNICRALPPNGVLVVKPHPYQVSIEPVSLYKRISSIPNLVLVKKSIKTVDLLKLCDAAITITGTVGIESIFNGKKAFCLADTIYSDCEEVERANSFEELSRILNNEETVLVADKRKVESYFHELSKVLYEVDFNKNFRNPTSNKEYYESVNMASKILVTFLNTYQ